MDKYRTFDKLWLRRLISEVINRMFVMHTKISINCTVKLALYQSEYIFMRVRGIKVPQVQGPGRSTLDTLALYDSYSYGSTVLHGLTGRELSIPRRQYPASCQSNSLPQAFGKCDYTYKPQIATSKEDLDQDP